MGNVLGRLEVLLADSADLKVGARRELQTMSLNYYRVSKRNATRKREGN